MSNLGYSYWPPRPDRWLRPDEEGEADSETSKTNYEEFDDV